MMIDARWLLLICPVCICIGLVVAALMLGAKNN